MSIFLMTIFWKRKRPSIIQIFIDCRENKISPNQPLFCFVSNKTSYYSKGLQNKTRANFSIGSQIRNFGAKMSKYIKIERSILKKIILS